MITDKHKGGEKKINKNQWNTQKKKKTSCCPPAQKATRRVSACASGESSAMRGPQTSTVGQRWGADRRPAEKRFCGGLFWETAKRRLQKRRFCGLFWEENGQTRIVFLFFNKYFVRNPKRHFLGFKKNKHQKTIGFKFVCFWKISWRSWALLRRDLRGFRDVWGVLRGILWGFKDFWVFFLSSFIGYGFENGYYRFIDFWVLRGDTRFWIWL